MGNTVSFIYLVKENRLYDVLSNDSTNIAAYQFERNQKLNSMMQSEQINDREGRSNEEKTA